MKTSSILFALISLLFGLNSQAQNQVLTEAIQHINKLKHISYTQITKQRGPFNDDTTILTIKSFINNTYDAAGKRIELYEQDETRGFKNVFNGSTRFDLDLKNRTYRITNSSDSAPYESPFYWADFMKENLIKSPEKIKLFPDTVINNTTCYHIKFLITVAPPSYSIYDVCINKANYLPLYTKVYLAGKFSKGGFTSDTINTMITENIYSEYAIEPKNFPDIAAINVPTGFNLEKKVKPLSTGQKAPDWKLSDTNGNLVSSNDLRGKVTLIDFSFIACAACALSLPDLNKLQERYQNTDVKIVSINVCDKKESVIKFIKKNSIKYPVFINGEGISKKFQAPGYPAFYLIDRQGNIATFIDGYVDHLGEKLIAQIDQLK